MQALLWEGGVRGDCFFTSAPAEVSRLAEKGPADAGRGGGGGVRDEMDRQERVGIGLALSVARFCFT